MSINIHNKLLNKNLILLWQGQFVSLIGTEIVYISLFLWIKQATGMATLMGLSGMIFSFSAILANPIGGTFADLYSRKTIIILCDVIAGISSLILCVILLINLNNIVLTLSLIFITQFIFGISSGIFEPTVNAIIPDIVPQDKIQSANSIKGSTIQICQIFGQSIGAILFRLLGMPVLMLVNGITFIFSAVSESFIKIPKKNVKPIKSSREGFIRFKNDFKQGIKFIWHKKELRDILILFALINFLDTPFLILLPFLVEDILKVSSAWYGYLIGFFGLGAISGFVITDLIKIPKKIKALFILINLIVLSVIFAYVGYINNLLIAVIVAVVFGFLSAFFDLLTDTAILYHTPTNLRGRVFGLVATLSAGLIPLGMSISGIIADLTGHNIPLIFLGAGILHLIMIIPIFSNKHIWRGYAFSLNEKEKIERRA